MSPPSSEPPARTTAPTPARCCVTVEDGRASAVQGDPDASADARRAVHQGLALRRAHVPPRARAAPAEARRPEGRRPLRAGRLGRGARRHRGAAVGASRRATRRGDRAVQLCRHDGAGAGREHGRALLPPARRVAARPHDLLVGRRRGAGRDLRRQGRHARRALRREPADRDLGQQLDHLEPALLDASRRRPSAPAPSWSASTRAAPRPPSKCHRAHRAAARAPTARWRSA